VELHGQLELQLDDGHLNTRSQTDSLPAVDGIASRPAATHLTIRRLRLALTGHVGQDADLVVQGHMDSRSDESELRDCYLRLRLPGDMTLLAGQFKVRFGREGLDSSTQTMTIERSDMSRALYQERDVGLNLSGGSPTGVRWDVGAFQGQGRNSWDHNGHKDASLRLVFPVSADLQLGVSGQLGTAQPDGLDTDLPVRRWGTDVLYRKGAWTWQSEAIFSQGWNSFSKQDCRAFGAYLGTTWTVARDWDLVAFYDWFDPNLDEQDPLVASNSLNARNRMVFGVNWYLDRQVPHRFMLNYEVHRPTEGPRLEPDGWRLRYQIRF
jgi:phosphate-selective porin